MIAVKLEGRLGNQLFQYAFIYNASKKLKCKFYLDKSIEPFLLGQYFNIEPDFCAFFDKNIFSIKGYKNIFSFHLRRKFYQYLQKLYTRKDVHFENGIAPALQMPLVRDKLNYTGYFQSEQYFYESRDDIRNLFTVKGKYTEKFKSTRVKLSLPDKYIAVHIRRGDYVGHNIALHIDYFHEIIKSVHHDDNYYVFVSDEPDIIETEFNYIQNKYISNNSEIIDFLFIANASTCILSNSSFSWWAAYLNKNATQVIAPKYWIEITPKKEYPVEVLPSSWLKFDHSC